MSQLPPGTRVKVLKTNEEWIVDRSYSTGAWLGREGSAEFDIVLWHEVRRVNPTIDKLRELMEYF